VKSKAKEAELNAKIAAKKQASSPAKAPAAKSKPAKITASGLGVVKGQEASGKVLPKETLDAGVLDYLKNYKQ